MREPQVTVGMPVYNAAETLREALESLRRQTFADFQVLLSDNASTDQTQAICTQYAREDERFRYFRNDRNVGAAANFNRVFALSESPYFKWMAHDDRIEPAYLQRCVEALDKSPSSVLAFPRRRFITHDGHDIVPGPDCYFHGLDGPQSHYDRLSFGRILRLHGGCFPMLVFGLMRAEAMRKTRLIGAFWSADLVFVAEMRMQGEFSEVPEPLYVQRLHAPTALWHSRQSKRGEAAWYGSNNGHVKQHPEVRLFLEYMRAIRHADLSPAGRTRCYLAMGCYLERTIRRLGGLALSRTATRARGLLGRRTHNGHDAAHGARDNQAPLDVAPVHADVNRGES